MAGGEQFYLARAACGLAAGHLLYRSELTLKLPLLPLFAALGLIMALATYVPLAAILLPFVACLCILAGRNGGSLFATAPAQALGYLSYTLYLVHIPVLRVMQLWFGTAIDANPLAKAAALVATFLLAWLLSVTIERPAMRLARYWPGTARKHV